MDELLTNILLISGAHGLLIFGTLLFRKKNRLANRIFSILILVITCNFFTLYGDISGIDDGPFFAFGLIPRFMYGPLIYLYIQVLIGNIENLRIKDFCHFFPALTDLTLMITTVAINFDPFTSVNPEFSRIFFVILEDLQTFLYLAASIRVLEKLKKMVPLYFSTIDRLRFRWIYMLLFILITFRIYSFTEIILLMNEFAIAESLDNISIIIESFFIYGISFLVLSQREIFNDVMKLKTTLEQKHPSDAKYKRTGLDKESGDNYLKKLVHHMNNKAPYRRSDLTLKGLSDELDLPAHQLSQVINSRLDQNFYSFINSYRIREACELLNNFDSEKDTILSIAFDVGFNSKTTFNEVFKKLIGKTPTQYRNSKDLTSSESV